MQLKVVKHFPNISISHPAVFIERPDQRMNRGEPKRGRPDSIIEVVCRGIIDYPHVVFSLGYRKVLDERLDLKPGAHHVAALENLLDLLSNFCS